eukprot:5178125-Amphidinium_carterae.1
MPLSLFLTVIALSMLDNTLWFQSTDTTTARHTLTSCLDAGKMSSLQQVDFTWTRGLESPGIYGRVLPVQQKFERA